MKTAFTDDTRHRYIQLGCGPHPLPSPWENYDREVDIGRALPFPSESVAFLFAEHVIEHLPYDRGLAFLRECFRVLEPRGTLRLCFPDVERFFNTGDHCDPYALQDRRETYYAFLRRHSLPADIGGLCAFILSNSGHKSAWSRTIAGASLIAVGFVNSTSQLYGDSDHPELRGIERHHFSVPESVAIAETTIIEATK